MQHVGGGSKEGVAYRMSVMLLACDLRMRATDFLLQRKGSER